MKRVGGIAYFKAGGRQYEAKGNFTYNAGDPKRETVVGADGVHGYTEKPQAAFVEGEITKGQGLKLSDLTGHTDGPIMLKLGDGDVFVIDDATYTADGTGNTEEGNFGIRFEGTKGRLLT